MEKMLNDNVTNFSFITFFRSSEWWTNPKRKYLHEHLWYYNQANEKEEIHKIDKKRIWKSENMIDFFSIIR